MGILSWLRAKPPNPPRPWVRPEFLGVTALVAVLAVVLLALNASQGPAQPEPSAELRRDYVGLIPSELGADPACDTACLLERRLAQWRAAHPDARILETTSMFYEGALIGYEIAYLE